MLNVLCGQEKPMAQWKVLTVANLRLWVQFMLPKKKQRIVWVTEWYSASTDSLLIRFLCLNF